MNKIILMTSILFILLLPATVLAGDDAQKSTGALKNKKIVMIIGSRMFHALEFLELKEIFKREDVNVIIASTTLSEAIGMGMHKLKVKPDILIHDIKVKDFDAVVFVGGPGAHEYSSDRLAHKIVKQTLEQGKVLAAIHLAPEILANAGVLKGKKAVAYMSYNIKTKGAIVTDKMVERDGNIITGRSQSAAKEFGEAIVAALGE